MDNYEKHVMCVSNFTISSYIVLIYVIVILNNINENSLLIFIPYIILVYSVISLIGAMYYGNKDLQETDMYIKKLEKKGEKICRTAW